MYKLHFSTHKRNLNIFNALTKSKRKLCSQSNTQLALAYNPGEVEKLELDKDYFSAPISPDTRPYTLILPPPNITGTLHLGHALTSVIQDALIKWNRVYHGKKTVWIPGLDHAGIATQVVVEKLLFKEQGLTRHQLGREKFERLVWKWKSEKQMTIIEQLKRLNVDLNWDKTVFTMDEQRSKAVTQAFIRLFDQGFIYRADYLVNWSCALQSAISDIEVDYVNIDGPTNISVPGYEKPVQFGTLTKFAYKVLNSEDEIVVATTRPETMLGDVAVAVNPLDGRYTNYIGKRLIHPFRNDHIPVIGDDFVDPSFGSGAVKVTPAHDPIDFEVAKRHNLRALPVINEKGLLIGCAQFKGLKRFDARETIVKQLIEKQLFRGVQNHQMSIPICSRSKDVIEFLIKPQWFMNCSRMAEKAVAAVREGHLQIEPRNFEKNWFQWLENIRDWCVSRQLWWGHRIPAYRCTFKGKSVWVAAESVGEAQIKAAKLLNCHSNNLECLQDEDVLDTWFSSALLPFSSFQWPLQAEDFDSYYPLSLMETGHDILFFWVARMVMLGTQLTGKLPFNRILLHGIICDSHGRKMSKSLGNVVAPEEVIEGASLDKLKGILELNHKNGILSKDELKKALEGQRKMFPKGIPECGSEALRFTLLSHNIKSHIINFDISECHTNKLFGNKIWQATRFALMWIDKVVLEANCDFEDNLATMDRWILSCLTKMLQQVELAMENGEFHLGAASLKNFLYYELCDVYLESVKTDLKEKTSENVAKVHCKTLLTCLDQGLRALAPFMPCLAQHLHKNLPELWNVGSDRSFPKINSHLRNEPLEKEVKEINELITGIRRLKKIFNVTYKYLPEVFLVPSERDVAMKHYQLIKDLSNLYALHILDKSEPEQKGLIKDFVGENKIFLSVPEELKQNLDLDREKMSNKKEKLNKEVEKLLEALDGPLSDTARENSLKKIKFLKEKIAKIAHIQELTR